MDERDPFEPAPAAAETPATEGDFDAEPIPFADFEFELELTPGSRTDIQAADRLLRTKREVVDAPAPIVPRKPTFH